MSAIVPIRTKNMQINLREVSIGDAVEICSISPKMREFGTSVTLRAICDESTDIRLLTVQERAFILSQYIAQTNGVSADFSIGENARYSNYLFYDKQYCDAETLLGDFQGKKIYARPVLGIHAESIERLMTQKVFPCDTAHWVFALMVCMFVFEDEIDSEKEDFSLKNDSEIDEYITEGIENLKSRPESFFLDLSPLFSIAIEKTNHLFKLAIANDGIVFSPVKSAKEGDGVEILPCRFQFISVLSEYTQQLFANTKEQNI